MSDLINYIADLRSPQILALSGLIIVALALIINYMSNAHKRKIGTKNTIIHKKDSLIQQRDSSIEKLLAIISPDFIKAMIDMQEELKELLAERAKWEHNLKDFKGEKSVSEHTEKTLEPEKAEWKPTIKDPQKESGTWEPLQTDTAGQIEQPETESKASPDPRRVPIQKIENFKTIGDRVFNKGETLGKLLILSVNAVKDMEKDEMKMIQEIYKKNQGKRTKT